MQTFLWVAQRKINPYRLRMMFVYAVGLRVQQFKRKDSKPAVVKNRIYLNLLFLKILMQFRHVQHQARSRSPW